MVMRDILFAVVMLSMPAAVALIAGKTLFSVEAHMAGARAVAASPEAGRAIYQRRCAACHGAGAGGTARGPGLLERALGTAMGRAAMRTAIRTGIAEPRAGYPAMPRFDGLTESEIGAVIRYLRESRHARSG